MGTLPWISDENLNASITTLLDRAAAAVSNAEARQRRNVIDPFSSLLIASTFGAQDESTLQGMQNSSSALRGMSNFLGMFHQQVLASVAGWINHDAGYDLESPSRRMLAEVKNKHNTMNTSNRKQVVTDLDTAVRQKGRGWTGYLVIIVPSTPVRYEKQIGARSVYEMDGASFYQVATGHANALHELYDVLSDRIGTSDEVKEYCNRILLTSIPPRIQPPRTAV